MELPEPSGAPHVVSDREWAAVKALGHDETHQFAVDFIINVLCGRHRMSFVAGVPNSSETMAFFEGRRSIGETIARLIERAIPTPPPAPLPPAKTQTEKARRRATKSTTS